MPEEAKKGLTNSKFLKIAVLLSVGCLMVLCLFLWYRTFAYYTHDIHTYNIEDITFDQGTGITQITTELSRLKRFYETVVYNQSSQEIMIDIYENGDRLLRDNIVIASGEEYKFESYSYAYKVILYGKDITDNNIRVEASTLSYLKIYRQSVIITMIIVIAVTFIWALLTVFKPEWVEKRGAGINMAAAIATSLGSILSCIIFYRGYFESDLCFLSLFCSGLALVMKKREPYKIWKEKTVIDKASMTDTLYTAAGVTALFFSCMMFQIMLNSREGSLFYIFNSKNHMSIIDYILTILIFLTLFLLISWLISKRQGIAYRIKYYFEGKEPFVCSLSVLAALFVQQETINLAGNWKHMFLCTLTFLFFFFNLLKNKEKNKNSFLLYLIYLITICMSACSTTVINYYHMGNNTHDYVHHIGWYYRQMYYIANNLPYPDSSLGLYGHYPIFYKIPVMLFGDNLLVIGIVTGIVGGMLAFFSIAIIHCTTKSNILRIMGSLAVLNVLAASLYIAIVPHRLVFPMMMLFYIVFCKNKMIKWYHVLVGILISILSLMWNTETGAVVLVTWIVFILLKKVEGKDDCLKYFITLIAGIIVSVLLCFTLIFVIFRNSDFWGELLNPGYMFSAHFNFIRWTNAPWTYIMILFLGVIAYGISRMGFFGTSRDKERKMPVMISIAVMGLGLMIYFISRPEDYQIMILPAVFLVIILLDEIRENREYLFIKAGGVRILSGIFFIIGISCMLAGTGDTVDSFLTRMIEHHQLDYSLLNEDMDYFASEVPKNSYAFGDGLSEIYMNLGWRLPLESERNQCEFLVTSGSDPGEQYQFVKEIPFGDMKYFLYRNNYYLEN